MATKQTAQLYSSGTLMEIDDIQHLVELEKAHRRRLRALELKAALTGADTPAQTLIEIEDLQAKVADVSSQLQRALVPAKNFPEIENEISRRALPYRQTIELVFRGDFNNISSELEDALIRALAALVNISPEQIEVLKIMSGSIIAIVNLPIDAGIRLVEMQGNEDSLLKELGVERITFVKQGDFLSLSMGVPSFTDLMNLIKEREKETEALHKHTEDIILILCIAIAVFLFIFLNNLADYLIIACIFYGIQVSMMIVLNRTIESVRRFRTVQANIFLKTELYLRKNPLHSIRYGDEAILKLSLPENNSLPKTEIGDSIIEGLPTDHSSKTQDSIFTFNKLITPAVIVLLAFVGGIRFMIDDKTPEVYVNYALIVIVSLVTIYSIYIWYYQCLSLFNEIAEIFNKDINEFFDKFKRRRTM